MRDHPGAGTARAQTLTATSSPCPGARDNALPPRPSSATASRRKIAHRDLCRAEALSKAQAVLPAERPPRRRVARGVVGLDDRLRRHHDRAAAARRHGWLRRCSSAAQSACRGRGDAVRVHEDDGARARRAEHMRAPRGPPPDRPRRLFDRPRRGLPRRLLPRRLLPRRLLRAASCRAASCRAASCRTASCRAASCRAAASRFGVSSSAINFFRLICGSWSASTNCPMYSPSTSPADWAPVLAHHAFAASIFSSSLSSTSIGVM